MYHLKNARALLINLVTRRVTDGNLTLVEFMLVFHLIVARKNNFDIPAILPPRLLRSGWLIP